MKPTLGGPLLKGRRRFVRNFEGGQHLDLFLVAAVSAVLVIRFSLSLGGYPALGGESMHIAHVLWGGALMLIAIALQLSYLGRMSQRAAALVGGVGFGTFIDEVGKFLSHDNDYFFKPSVAIIYAVFILLYLAVRSIHREQTATQDEYLVNALQEMEEVAFGDLDREERDRALHYLENSDPKDPLVVELKTLIQCADLVPTPGPGRLVRLRRAVFRFYRRMASRGAFPIAVVIFFIFQLVLKLAHVVTLVFFGEAGRRVLEHVPFAAYAGGGAEKFSFVDAGQLVSTLLAACFVALGVFSMKSSRLTGFRMFQRSVLVSIFLGQVFMFYEQQWAALVGLSFELFLFLGLRFMIERERGLNYGGGR